MKGLYPDLEEVLPGISALQLINSVNTPEARAQLMELWLARCAGAEGLKDLRVQLQTENLSLADIVIVAEVLLKLAQMPVFQEQVDDSFEPEILQMVQEFRDRGRETNKHRLLETFKRWNPVVLAELEALAWHPLSVRNGVPIKDSMFQLQLGLALTPDLNFNLVVGYDPQENLSYLVLRDPERGDIDLLSALEEDSVPEIHDHLSHFIENVRSLPNREPSVVAKVQESSVAELEALTLESFHPWLRTGSPYEEAQEYLVNMRLGAYESFTLLLTYDENGKLVNILASSILGSQSLQEALAGEPQKRDALEARLRDIAGSLDEMSAGSAQLLWMDPNLAGTEWMVQAQRLTGMDERTLAQTISNSPILRHLAGEMADHERFRLRSPRSLRMLRGWNTDWQVAMLGQREKELGWRRSWIQKGMTGGQAKNQEVQYDEGAHLDLFLVAHEWVHVLLNQYIVEGQLSPGTAAQYGRMNEFVLDSDGSVRREFDEILDFLYGDAGDLYSQISGDSLLHEIIAYTSESLADCSVRTEVAGRVLHHLTYGQLEALIALRLAPEYLHPRQYSAGMDPDQLLPVTYFAQVSAELLLSADHSIEGAQIFLGIYERNPDEAMAGLRFMSDKKPEAVPKALALLEDTGLFTGQEEALSLGGWVDLVVAVEQEKPDVAQNVRGALLQRLSQNPRDLAGLSSAQHKELAGRVPDSLLRDSFQAAQALFNQDLILSRQEGVFVDQALVLEAVGSLENLTSLREDRQYRVGWVIQEMDQWLPPGGGAFGEIELAGLIETQDWDLAYARARWLEDREREIAEAEGDLDVAELEDRGRTSSLARGLGGPERREGQPQASGSGYNRPAQAAFRQTAAASTYDPQAMMGFVKNNLGQAERFEQAIDPLGTTLEQHTLQTMENLEQLRPQLNQAIRSSSPWIRNNVPELMRVVGVFHDAGKPDAIEEFSRDPTVGPHPRQSHFTIPYLRQQMQMLGYDPQSIEFVATLVDGDPIGQAVQGKLPVDLAYDQIRLKWEHLDSVGIQVDFQVFFQIHTLYWMGDALSYEYFAETFNVASDGTVTVRRISQQDALSNRDLFRLAIVTGRYHRLEELVPTYRGQRLRWTMADLEDPSLDLLREKIWTWHATAFFPRDKVVHSGARTVEEHLAGEAFGEERPSSFRPGTHWAAGELVRPNAAFTAEDRISAVGVPMDFWIRQMEAGGAQLINLNSYDVMVLGDVRLDQSTVILVPFDLERVHLDEPGFYDLVGQLGAEIYYPGLESLREAVERIGEERGAWPLRMLPGMDTGPAYLGEVDFNQQERFQALFELAQSQGVPLSFGTHGFSQVGGVGAFGVLDQAVQALGQAYTQDNSLMTLGQLRYLVLLSKELIIRIEDILESPGLQEQAVALARDHLNEAKGWLNLAEFDLTQIRTKVRSIVNSPPEIRSLYVAKRGDTEELMRLVANHRAAPRGVPNLEEKLYPWVTASLDFLRPRELRAFLQSHRDIFENTPMAQIAVTYLTSRWYGLGTEGGLAEGLDQMLSDSLRSMNEPPDWFVDWVLLENNYLSRDSYNREIALAILRNPQVKRLLETRGYIFDIDAPQNLDEVIQVVLGVHDTGPLEDLLDPDENAVLGFMGAGGLPVPEKTRLGQWESVQMLMNMLRTEASQLEVLKEDLRNVLNMQLIYVDRERSKYMRGVLARLHNVTSHHRGSISLVDFWERLGLREEFLENYPAANEYARENHFWSQRKSLWDVYGELLAAKAAKRLSPDREAQAAELLGRSL
ncbi:MAG: hypothetical protein JW937_07725 [Candidatus Omnitrophica bacterium]|nr:hypothetical protein [Candidatus Omnitrophota bacterium]